MPSRTRIELTAYLAEIARPFTKPGFYVFDILHDDWCPLAKNSLADRCTCSPTVDLVEQGDHGEVLTRLHLLIDGQVQTPSPS